MKSVLIQCQIIHIYLFEYFYFVSIHVLGFTHSNHNFIEDNDYAIVFRILGIFMRQNLKSMFFILHVLCAYIACNISKIYTFNFYVKFSFWVSMEL